MKSFSNSNTTDMCFWLILACTFNPPSAISLTTKKYDGKAKMAKAAIHPRSATAN